jgi:hypothetical protein
MRRSGQPIASQNVQRYDGPLNLGFDASFLVHCSLEGEGRRQQTSKGPPCFMHEPMSRLPCFRGIVSSRKPRAFQPNAWACAPAVGETLAAG